MAKLSRDQKRKAKLKKRKALKVKIKKIPNLVLEVTRRQFDALCFARHPMARVTANEKQWYTAYDKKIIASVFQDNIDGDYGYVILGRDKRKMFRSLEVSKVFKQTPELARNELFKNITKYRNDGVELYEQFDEVKLPNELFTPQVGREKLNPIFIALAEEPRYEAARNLIREIVYSFDDPDGHYIKEFQTHGFDARLWELYLYTYLHAGFRQIKGNAAPDFHITNGEQEYLIEAVTVNESKNKDRLDEPAPENPAEAAELLNDYMPIKFGSPLYSKLNKRYWEKEHVAGKPLILAIHDFHSSGSMTWSRNGLSEYLYGVRTRLVDGKPLIENIKQHEWKGKVIPSGFFSQPESENISAILFSNAATLPKFNRMGKLAGLGSEKVRMFRKGLRYDPSPDAFQGIPFMEDVDSDDYEESWSDSIVMFHNTNAKHPVNPNDFDDISHIFYSEEDGFTGYHQPYDVLSSITVVLTEKEPELESEVS